MENFIFTKKQFKLPIIGKTPLYPIIFIIVFFLAIFQDYIYSQLQHTGFYISESALYNTFWMFFIPFTFFTNRLIKSLPLHTNWSRFFMALGIGTAISLLHILLFTSFFVLVSNLIYTPPHGFITIFKTALSNQLYIALLVYIIVPNFHRFTIFTNQPTHAETSKYPSKIMVKHHSKITTVETSSIQLIATDRPYSMIYTTQQKYLVDKSLKEFQKELDPAIFRRVHRSAIVNETYITELKSRKNGDYDAILKDGKSIRFSRHFRQHWEHLLQ